MTQWHYESIPDLDQSLIERLRSFPREPDMLLYGIRSAAALGLRTWLRIYHRFEIIGREHLPRDRSFVMVCNHASHLDALCLLSALPLRQLHRTFPAAAADYFFVSLRRTLVAAVFINALPFDRELHIRQSLSLCRELLARAGSVLILFPEGTRSLSGEVGEFKLGIGLLLAGTDVPVVPCHLEGAHQALAKGTRYPRPRSLRLKIGPPRTFCDLPRSKESMLRISGELRQSVLDLGQLM